MTRPKGRGRRRMTGGSRRTAKPPVPVPVQVTEPVGMEALLWGSPGKKVVTAAAVVAALLYFAGVFKPVVDSHLPSASQDELNGGLASVKKGLDQTVATATAANQQAQQALRQSQSNQLDRLLAQRVQLEILVNMNPTDATLKSVLERTNIDINRLAAVTQAPPLPSPGPQQPPIVAVPL